MSEETKEFYVMVNGQKVMVSEEVYRVYVRPIRAEQKRADRSWRCKISKEMNGKIRFIRCRQDCSKCQYALSGNNATGNLLSLNQLQEMGIEATDNSIDVEENYIQKETVLEDKERVQKTISRLTKRQQQLVRWIYFEEKSQSEVAENLGVGKTAINNAMKRIYSSLKKYLEKN